MTVMLDPEAAEGPPPSAVRVELVFKAAFSSPKSRETIFWPEGWRLPQAGESVQLRKDFGGFVNYVEWDLAEGLVRVMLR